jgi:hypothetical protein
MKKKVLLKGDPIEGSKSSSTPKMNNFQKRENGELRPNFNRPGTEKTI